jgi:hypothetical protein
MMWPFAMLKRFIIFIHRWLGIALCVLFLVWFPSGIGMMYWTFPSVTAADRLERSPALEAARVVLSPAEAAAKAGIEQPGAVRLNSFDSRPVYRFGGGRGGGRMVFADTGEEQLEVSRLLVPRVASAWTGQPVSQARVEPIDEVDQWTVQASLRTLRPLWKYSWPNGEQVYVSEATGEVIQYTTTVSRIGAYLGPIPHWFYFTPLRKHGLEWSRVVIWSSGVGTIAAMLGIIVGVWIYSPSKRYRYDGAPSALPYYGQKRWHTVLGLVFGVAAATYAFSGMLSMDPFPSRTGGRPAAAGGESVDIQQALRGRWSLDAFEDKHPADALRQLTGLAVKELELTSFAGEPVYMATLAGGDTRIVPVQGEPQIGFPQERIVQVVSTAAEGRVDTKLLEQYDRYYLDRHRERPLPVILAQLTDGEKTRYYIDPRTARIVGSYDSRNWVNRWLYTGLHSLNFPWLYNYRPLWDIVVITLMLGGTALGVTSLILAWRVLGRKLARVLSTGRPSRETRLREDLA